eukprot:8986-Eustigmatos_ZCMA.PRE.1
MEESRTQRIELQQEVSLKTMLWVREMLYRGSSELSSAPDDVLEALQTVGWMEVEFIAAGLVNYLGENVTVDNFWMLVDVAYRLDCEEL